MLNLSVYELPIRTNSKQSEQEGSDETWFVDAWQETVDVRVHAAEGWFSVDWRDETSVGANHFDIQKSKYIIWGEIHMRMPGVHIRFEALYLLLIVEQKKMSST